MWKFWFKYQIKALGYGLIGLPVCLYLAYTKSWILRPSRSPFYPGHVWAWKQEWAQVWGNEEDGVRGPVWYEDLHPKWSESRRAFVWTAWRNSANNMRLLPGAQERLSSVSSKRWLFVSVLTDSSGRQCIRIAGRRFGWNMNENSQAGDYTWPVI